MAVMDNGCNNDVNISTRFFSLNFHHYQLMTMHYIRSTLMRIMVEYRIFKTENNCSHYRNTQQKPNLLLTRYLFNNIYVILTIVSERNLRQLRIYNNYPINNLQ